MTIIWHLLVVMFLIVLSFWVDKDWLHVICGAPVIVIGVDVADTDVLYGLPFIAIGLSLLIHAAFNFTQSRRAN